MKCSNLLILSAVFVAYSLFIVVSTIDAGRADGPNGSTKTLSWNTNNSIVSDKIRTYGKGFNLTKEEEQALDKFRPHVEDLALLPFHRRDNFLIKFLRARNMDILAATEMYKEAMDWRRSRDLDKLLNTDFTKWEKLFPFIISGLDKQKGPVFYMLVAAYDIRKAVVAGHSSTMETVFDRSFELSTRLSAQIYETTGENVGLAGTLIIDLAGFNLRQHACARCLSIFAYIINSYERYWPQFLRQMILVNAPSSFEIILQIVRPIMSPATRKAFEVYGVDKSVWEPVLKKYIDDDQLLVRYGGSRTLSSFSSQTYGG